MYYLFLLHAVIVAVLCLAGVDWSAHARFIANSARAAFSCVNETIEYTIYDETTRCIWTRRKMAKIIVVLVAALFVQESGSEDLYWVHNTNWDEPSNWALKRVPCGRDTVTVRPDISERPAFFFQSCKL